ncbi:MAG: PilN domain-containing protein [Aestuariibacter sp.]
MSHINLLPWREQQRERNKKNYVVILGICAALSAGLMLGIGHVIDLMVDGQQKRNQFMETQISLLDLKIEKIKKIKEAKEQLEQRIVLIGQLQESRNVATRVMDELAKLLPPGVAFKTVNRKDDIIEIVGVSESNNRLANFMRNIENSSTFIQGELSSIKADTTTTDAVSDFKIKFRISPAVSPNPIAVAAPGTAP